MHADVRQPPRPIKLPSPLPLPAGAYEKDETGFNSCGFGKLDPTWETMYAALPSHVFDRDSDCGRCIRVRGTEDDAPGDWVTVRGAWPVR